MASRGEESYVLSLGYILLRCESLIRILDIGFATNDVNVLDGRTSKSRRVKRRH